MPRCKHPRESVTVRTFDRDKCWLDLACNLCGVKWCGFGLAWRSRAGKLHKPPEWVKLIVGTLITTDA